MYVPVYTHMHGGRSRAGGQETCGISAFLYGENHVAFWECTRRQAWQQVLPPSEPSYRLVNFSVLFPLVLKLQVTTATATVALKCFIVKSYFFRTQ